MSYILEALKKAQAERQLGNAPTIHAPAPNYTVPTARASRNPIIIGVVAGTLVVALGAVFLLRQPAPAPAVQLASAPAQVAAPAAVPASGAAPAAPVSAPEPVAASVGAPAASPEIAAPPVPPKPAAPARPAETAKPEAPPPARPASTLPPPAEKAEPAPRTAPAEVASETSRPVLVATAPAAPSADDGVGPLQSLPESVQRDIPKVSFGGYIYSPNPAERLLLVDKMLRREGEEVAPGLVLERLLPKAAIMNYRGYRYRVGY